MRNTLIHAVTILLSGCLYVASAAAGQLEYVYVESNIQTTGGNSILAYSRHGDSALTPVPGSPFPTGGAGVQDTSFVFGPYDSDQNIAIDRSRRPLFAVNSGSDTIAVFRIREDGSLAAVAGSPFPSGGVNPVSLAISGDILFVVNKNGDFGRLLPVQPNYTTLRIASDGSLSAISNAAPIEVAFGSSPSQAYLARGKKIMFGADFRGGLLQSFIYDDEGRLTQNPTVALPRDPAIPVVAAQAFGLGNFPLGLWGHPYLPLLYVGQVVDNQVGVYRYDEHGRLTYLRSSPVSGLAICWLRINRRATRLYTSNNGVVGGPRDAYSSVSVFDLTDPASPREIQNLQLTGVGNSAQIELSSNESVLYAVSQRATAQIPPGQGNALHAFTILPDGTLVENYPPIPISVPVGTQPQGLAVYHPD